MKFHRAAAAIAVAVFATPVPAQLTEPTAARAQRALALACDNLTAPALAAQLQASTPGTRQPLRPNGIELGWQQSPRFEDGSHLLVRRIAPSGNLRGVSIEHSDRLGRPLLLLQAPGDCQVRTARLFEHAVDDGEDRILELDAALRPTGRSLTLNPAVPPGDDVTGVSVALVDAGVNYLLQPIARRLGRRPDGSLAGFDFWDLDARPFDAHPVRSPFFPQRHGTRIASVILREAPRTRLLPYRYPRPDMRRMKELLQHAAEDGARIVNLSLGGNRREEWTTFATAARAQPGLLFIVSAGNNGRDIDRQPVFPAALELDNAITVTSANADGSLARGSNWGARSVDLLVPGERLAALGFDGQIREVSGSSYAAARVSALAARLLESRPGLSTAELRAAVLALATPIPGALVSSGWIEQPLRLARDADLAHSRVLRRETWRLGGSGSGYFRPTLILLADSGWQPNAVRELIANSAALLRQCAIAIDRVEFIELAASDNLRDFSRINAGLLVQLAAGEGARVFFVRDTLDRPAFDAVTFGTANSRRQPELRHSVWITATTRDPPQALAHELAHVLLDSGEHATSEGNLMRADTSPSNTGLDAQQCERMRDRATRNGLLSDAG